MQRNKVDGLENKQENSTSRIAYYITATIYVISLVLPLNLSRSIRHTPRKKTHFPTLRPITLVCFYLFILAVLKEILQAPLLPTACNIAREVFVALEMKGGD